MPALRPVRPVTRVATSVPDIADSATSRAFDTVSTSLAHLEDDNAPEARVVVDLAIGANRITHGLRRVAKHMHVTPTVPDATFAAALTGGDARTAIVTVVGVAQPQAGVVLS